MLDSFVRVSRRVAWNHMTGSNLGIVCALFPSQQLCSIWAHGVQSKNIHCKSALGFKFVYHTQAIKLVKTSCLLAGLLNQLQQLLTHTDGKCILQSEDKPTWSIWIRNNACNDRTRLNLNNALLISCAFPFNSFTQLLIFFSKCFSFFSRGTFRYRSRANI